jgi:protein-tyrosine phosphatase
LAGFVDIHSHIIPGVDDGATSVDDAVAMIEAAAACGTAEIVATPHANGVYTFDPVVTKRKLAELQERVGTRVRLGYGCELHLTFDNVADAARHPEKYAINGHSYVLVEMSNFAVPDSLAAAFGALQSAGLRPVLAHPERNVYAHAGLHSLERLIGAGVLMQVTGQAVMRNKTAQALIRAGWAHAVASDTHGVDRRSPSLAEAYQWVRLHIGERAAERLFRENPAAIVSGAALPE